MRFPPVQRNKHISYSDYLPSCACSSRARAVKSKHSYLWTKFTGKCLQNCDAIYWREKCFRYSSADLPVTNSTLPMTIPCTRRSANRYTFIPTLQDICQIGVYLQKIVFETIIKSAHAQSSMWLLITLAGIFSTGALSPCVKDSFIQTKHNPT